MKKIKSLRNRGIEPRSVPWEGTMIPLHQLRFLVLLYDRNKYNIKYVGQVTRENKKLIQSQRQS